MQENARKEIKMQRIREYYIPVLFKGTVMVYASNEDDALEHLDSKSEWVDYDFDSSEFERDDGRIEAGDYVD